MTLFLAISPPTFRPFPPSGGLFPVSVGSELDPYVSIKVRPTILQACASHAEAAVGKSLLPPRSSTRHPSTAAVETATECAARAARAAAASKPAVPGETKVRFNAACLR